MKITTATNAEHELYVTNIIAAWELASADQEARGRSWYRTAHQLAEMMSEGNTRTAAGVIAALSPQTLWEDNLRRAERVLDQNAAGDELSGHMGDALRKCARILAGEDPHDVLPLNSKTLHFFQCIADPDDADAVVIDRHAHDIAVGERYTARDRGLGSKIKYATFAHAYREAARILGELPSTVQAVTWVYWRELES